MINKKVVKAYDFFFILALLCAGVIINGLGLLSPAYFSIIFLSLIFVLFFSKLKSTNLLQNQILLLPIFWFVLEILINPSGDIKTGLFVILSILYYIFFDLLLYSLSKRKKLKYSVVYVHFCIIIYCFELITRFYSHDFVILNLINPSFYVNLFYPFKENIILGGNDTNFIATHLLIIFFYSLYLQRRFQLKLYTEMIFILILLFFTFSRSGWISFSIGFPFMILIHSKKKQNIDYRKIFLFSVIVVFFLFFIMNTFVDGSFLTKIDIVNKTINYVNTATLRDLIFGLGYLNSIQIIKYNVAHNLISTLIIDTGIVSLILMCIIWIYIIKKSKGYALYVLFPIFIFSLSFIQQLIPYLYICLAFINSLEMENECHAICNNSSI